MAFGTKSKQNSELAPATKDDNFIDVVDGNGNYAIMKMPVKEITTMLRDNLGAEKLTANDLNRITVPTGGNTTWTISTVEGEMPAQAIEGVIVLTQSVRAYWKESFDESGGGSPPDCVARDGLIGVGNPGGDCLKCPLNDWNTAKAGKGRGKACSESRLVYLVTEGEILPMVIKAPATSLGNARKYLFGLTSKRQPVHSVYTRLTLEMDKNADGIKYSKINFTKIGDVENPGATKEYAEKLRPYLEAASESMMQQQEKDPIN